MMRYGAKEGRPRVVETPNGVEVDGKVVSTSQLARVFGADPELMVSALARSIVSNPLAVGEPSPPFRRLDALSPKEPRWIDPWQNPPDGVLLRYAGTTPTNRGWWRTLLGWLGLR